MSEKIICHDINNKKEEVDSGKFRFRPSVYGILIEDNKILLSKQWDGYDFPGGGVEIHETLEKALVREFFEETGLRVEVLAPVYQKTSFFNPNYFEKYKGQYWNCPMMYSLVRKIGGELSVNNFDEGEKVYADLAEWVGLEKLKDIKIINEINPLDFIDNACRLLRYFDDGILTKNTINN